MSCIIADYQLMESLASVVVYGMNSWASERNNFGNFFSGLDLDWSFGGPPSGAYGPYLLADKDINNAGIIPVIPIIPMPEIWDWRSLAGY